MRHAGVLRAFRWPAFVLMAVSGCGGSAAVEQPTARTEVTTEVWALRQLDGKSVHRARPETATIQFLADHGVGGTSVCNDVGGSELKWFSGPSGKNGAVKRDRTEATITTVVGCLDGRATEVADRFWRKMRMANAWSLQGRTLHINFSDGSVAELVPAGTSDSNRTIGCTNGNSSNLDCPSQG
jgi:hypothetical protein